MLGWFAFLWLSPGPAPYHYRLVEEGGIDKFSKLGLDAWPDLGISKQEIVVDGVDEPVACPPRKYKARYARLGKSHRRTSGFRQQ
jgi:hydroxylamine oxidation protein HaoB